MFIKADLSSSRPVQATQVTKVIAYTMSSPASLADLAALIRDAEDEFSSNDGATACGMSVDGGGNQVITITAINPDATV